MTTEGQKKRYIARIYREMNNRDISRQEARKILSMTGFYKALNEYPDEQITLNVHDAVDEILSVAARMALPGTHGRMMIYSAITQITGLLRKIAMHFAKKDKYPRKLPATVRVSYRFGKINDAVAKFLKLTYLIDDIECSRNWDMKMNEPLHASKVIRD